MLLTSRLFKAYFKRLRSKTINGKLSRNLCGPGEGRGAYHINKEKNNLIKLYIQKYFLITKVPDNLSNIHDFGAARRFKCLRGPRA